MYVAAMCVLALVVHGRKERPLCRSMFFVTPDTWYYEMSLISGLASASRSLVS